MNDNLIKILINNTYHGFLGLSFLIAFIYTANSLIGKQSVFGWIVLILLVVVYIYHTNSLISVKVNKDGSSK